MDTMRPYNSEFVVTRNKTVQRGRSPEPYYETSSDESEVEQQISAEQTSQEHSEVQSAKSEDSGPIPSTSKGHLAPHKRRNQMRVREGRKKFRPDEKKSAKSFDRERKV